MANLPTLADSAASGEGSAHEVHRCFELAAARNGDAVALKWWRGEGDVQKLSYRCLDELASTAAEALHVRLMESGGGVKSASEVEKPRVAVLVPDGVEWVASLMAVLKAGAAFCPLDARMPLPRLAFMLADVTPCILIAPTTLVERCHRAAVLATAANATYTDTDEHGTSASMVVMDVEALYPRAAIARAFATRCGGRTTPCVHSTDGAHVSAVATGACVAGRASSGSRHHHRGAGLCYIVHTSGSTGWPKGVAVDHSAALAYVDAYASRVGISDACESTVLVASAFTFDPAIGDVFTALCNGGCVALAPWTVLTQDMATALQVLRPTHVLSTPSLWELAIGVDTSGVLSLPASVSLVALGGEPMSPQLIHSWAEAATAARDEHRRARFPRLLNVYGVTEACVYQLAKEFGRAPTQIGSSGSSYARNVPTNGAKSSACHDAHCIGEPLSGVVATLLPIETDKDETMPTVDISAANVSEDTIGELLLGGPQLARSYWVAPGFCGVRDAGTHATVGASVASEAPDDMVAQIAGELCRHRARVQELNACCFQVVVPYPGCRPMRMYRTGDLAFRRPLQTASDASVPAGTEFVLQGRRDAQLKLAGQRTEPSEIEGALCSCRLVQRAAVALVAQPSGRKLLVAFVVFVDALAAGTLLDGANNAKLISSIVLAHARAVLPARLIPSQVLPVNRDQLPLTSSAKLDRRRLGDLYKQLSGTDASQYSSSSGGTSGANEHMPEVKTEALSLGTAVMRVWARTLALPTEHTACLEADDIQGAEWASWDFGGMGGDSLAALRVSKTLRDVRWPGALSKFAREGSAGDIQSTHGVHAQNGAGPDYGVIAGALAPAELLRRPVAAEYVRFLYGSLPRPAQIRIIRYFAPDLCASDEHQGHMDAPTDQSQESLTVHQPNLPDGDDTVMSDMRGALATLLVQAAAEGILVAVMALLSAPILARADGHYVARSSGPEKKLKTKLQVAMTPLHAAARSGHCSVITALLDAGATPNAVNAMRASPLHFATQCTTGAAPLKVLLARGVAVSVRDANKQTALHWAARLGNADAVYALHQYFIDARQPEKSNASWSNFIEAGDRWGRRAIHWAVLNARVDAVKALLAVGASPAPGRVPKSVHSRRTRLHYESPLHIAVRTLGTIDASTEVTPHEADVVDNISKAKERVNRFQVLQLLLKSPASVDVVHAVDDNGCTALHNAVTQHCGAHVISELLMAGADPVATNYQGRSSLEMARDASNVEVLDLLAAVNKGNNNSSAADT